MTSDKTTLSEWEEKRTDESRAIEKLLRGHFESADAYRYNSASIRVRIVDPKFEGLTREQRDDLLEPVLSQLDEDTQRDIINLVLLYPNETDESFQASIMNQEFEHPSQSLL